jgi:hypothetical protein
MYDTSSDLRCWLCRLTLKCIMYSWAVHVWHGHSAAHYSGFGQPCLHAQPLLECAALHGGLSDSAWFSASVLPSVLQLSWCTAALCPESLPQHPMALPAVQGVHITWGHLLPGLADVWVRGSRERWQRILLRSMQALDTVLLPAYKH